MLPVNYDEVDEPPWHFLRTCPMCGYQWGGLHCPHDGFQNPCPNCGEWPEVVQSPTNGCRCEFNA